MLPINKKRNHQKIRPPKRSQISRMSEVQIRDNKSSSRLGTGASRVLVMMDRMPTQKITTMLRMILKRIRMIRIGSTPRPSSANSKQLTTGSSRQRGREKALRAWWTSLKAKTQWSNNSKPNWRSRKTKMVKPNELKKRKIEKLSIYLK